MTTGEQESRNAKSDPMWLTHLRAALADLPADYPTSYQEMVRMRHQFLTELSTALAGKLNPHVHQLPQETLAEKQQIATTVNRDLRLLNLCIRCPVTQGPAILVADCRDLDRTSRFRFQSFDAAGHRRRRGVSDHVPELQLMEAPAREESLAMHGSPLPHEGPSR